MGGRRMEIFWGSTKRSDLYQSQLKLRQMFCWRKWNIQFNKRAKRNLWWWRLVWFMASPRVPSRSSQVEALLEVQTICCLRENITYSSFLFPMYQHKLCNEIEPQQFNLLLGYRKALLVWLVLWKNLWIIFLFRVVVVRGVCFNFDEKISDGVTNAVAKTLYPAADHFDGIK